ncbi:MAG: ApaG domain, partial [Alphaproteobacteria bacterium]|nr:ApaG domain [Alphaproteobacteria bacterium]
MYERITRGIKVIVRPQYLEGQSKPDEDHFVWAYTITVENHGRETVTLKTRYWKITDATGKMQ